MNILKHGILINSKPYKHVAVPVNSHHKTTKARKTFSRQTRGLTSERGRQER